MTLAAISIAVSIAALQGIGDLREQAIDELSRGTDDRIEAVLDSVDWRGRDAVVMAMERSRPPRIEMMLNIAMRHPEIAVRRTAIRSLGRVGPVGTCDSLLALLGKGSDAVVLDAITGRDDCRKEAIAPFLDAEDQDSRRRALMAYHHLDASRARGVAGERLGDRAYSVREAASGILRGTLASVEVIENHLDRLDDVGKTTALFALGKLPGTRSEHLLTQALSSQWWPHRNAGAVGLGHMGSPKHLDSLTARLGVEGHPIVRDALIRAISDLKRRTE
jgi:HEAT repeat protein